MTVASFSENAVESLRQLRGEVLNGTYTPTPLKEISVPKGGSRERRILRLPSIRDKVVQEVVRSGMDPQLDRIFLDMSYGYRPGKGPQRAARRVTHEIVAGKSPWAATADIDDFFGSLDHSRLLALLRAHFPDDPELLRLIELWLRMGAIDRRQRWLDIRRGVGQGAVISPLLANLYLHEFDVAISREHRMVRYADDFVLLAPSGEKAWEAFHQAVAFLRENLGLNLNEDVSPVASPEEGFCFLGLWFVGAERRLAPDRAASIRRRLDAIARNADHEDPERFLNEVNLAVLGWKRYYGVLLSEGAAHELDVMLLGALSDGIARLRRAGRLPHLRAGLTLISRFELVVSRTDSDRRAIDVQIWKGTDPGESPVSQTSLTGSRPSEQPRRTPPTPQRVVQTSRRRHHITRAVASDLVINTPGHFVGKSGERIVVRFQRKTVAEVPVLHLGSLTIAARGVSLSSDVLTLCAQKGVPLLVVDGISRVQALLSSPAAKKVGACVGQVKALSDPRVSLGLAKAFAIGKIRNQMALMKYAGKYRRRADPDFSARLDRAREEVGGLLRELKALRHDRVEDPRQSVFLLEGRAAQWYWDLFRLAAGGASSFPSRVGRGARDPVNMLLNYGYAVLQSRVQLAIVRSGLAPEIGFLHASTERRLALVFDLMEEFRAPVVDRVVLAYLNQRQPTELGTDGLLHAETRGRIIRRLRERLGSLVRYGDRQLTLEEVLNAQARRLAAQFGGGAPYRPFLATW
ncbi:MAG: CRISPR-associated endonuclease Cas1 [Gemmatimonadota bacterium]